MQGACLQVVSEDEDRDAQDHAAELLDEHMGEALRVLLRQRVKEVAPQED